MIYSAFIAILKLILTPILWILPSISSLPSGMNSAIDWFFNQLAGINYFIPIGSTLIEILNLSFFYVLVIAGFAIGNWTINKLRGSG